MKIIQQRINPVILTLFLFGASDSIHAQVVSNVRDTASSAQSAQPALVEKTIEYNGLSDFLLDIDRVRATYGNPLPENATTVDVPRTVNEVLASMVFGEVHTSEEFKPSECQDEISYYAVIWKPVRGVRAVAPVDIMFGIKSFDRTGTSSPCVGRSGNWHQSFTIPSTATLPDYLLNR